MRTIKGLVEFASLLLVTIIVIITIGGLDNQRITPVSCSISAEHTHVRYNMIAVNESHHCEQHNEHADDDDNHDPHHHHNQHHQRRLHQKHHYQNAHRKQYPSASHATSKQPHEEQVASSSSSASHIKPPVLKLQFAPESRQMRNKCRLAEREIDRCSAQLIGLGQSDKTMYPDSMQELDSIYCPKFREAASCIKNNTECFKPFERQVISWVLTSTRKMNYKRCKNPNEKVRFLKLTSSCFASMQNPMDECMSRYIGSLDSIAEYDRELERLAEDDIQIQLACCANRRFKQCVMDGAKRMCRPHDSLSKLRRTNSNTSQRVARKQVLRAVQDTMEDLKSTLDQMALTGPEFVCNNIDEKFCKSKFDGRYTNGLSRHQSIVPAMLKIYANK